MSASPAKALTEKKNADAKRNLIFDIRKAKPAAVKFDFPAISSGKSAINLCWIRTRRRGPAGYFLEVVRPPTQFKSGLLAAEVPCGMEAAAPAGCVMVRGSSQRWGSTWRWAKAS